MSIESNIIEFRKAFDREINSTPTLLGFDDMSLHLNLVAEELNELTTAWVKDDIVEVFDGIVDTIYVLAGLAVHMGLPLDEGWRAVHSSNLSKLGSDGEPLYHDGTDGPVGKVKKGPGYSPPDLRGLIEGGY